MGGLEKKLRARGGQIARERDEKRSDSFESCEYNPSGTHKQNQFLALLILNTNCENTECNFLLVRF